jgi:plasmid stabilization system protein ParE
MPHISWSTGAFADLDRLYRHLSVNSRTSALRAVRDISEGLVILEAFPLLGRRLDGAFDRREWVIRFGHGAYIVTYEVQMDAVTILTLRHGREDPHHETDSGTGTP